jgi:hypothetical protein
LGRRGCWRYRPVPPRQAPPAPLRLLPPPQQQRRVPCSPEQQGAGAPSAPRVLRQWGMATNSSGLPHRVPLAFVALLNGLGRRYLLQARKLHRQHMYSRHRNSTTLLKMVYLMGRGLRDLQLHGHALAGRIARPPRRRGQTSLQASRLILKERDVK